MAYLSRIWINPLRQQARRLLADPQAMHAAVLGGIPHQPVKERVLWRVDADEPRRPGLLVLSQSRPSWEHLVEQAGWPTADEPQAVTRPYAPLLERLAEGSRFAFRLTANPVQSTRRPDKMTPEQRERAVNDRLDRGARVGHRTVEHQLAWLLERTAQWGFRIPPARSTASVQADVPDVRITSRARRTFQRRPSGDETSNRSGKRVVLQVVTFEGLLDVIDPEALRERLLRGCGPAKAYGCGLLTLARLPSGAAGSD